jgi:hypothetical protein
VILIGWATVGTRWWKGKSFSADAERRCTQNTLIDLHPSQAMGHAQGIQPQVALSTVNAQPIVRRDKSFSSLLSACSACHHRLHLRKISYFAMLWTND